MNTLDKAEEFLRQTGMHPDAINLDTCLRQYVAEMERGLRGEACTLAMLPTHVYRSEIENAHGQAIAIDMGGTNLRIARISRDAYNTVSVANLLQYGMPGVATSIGWREFFDTLADMIIPYAADVNRIGISFAYETKILPSMEGEIVALAKEVSITGIEGLRLGECLKNALARKGCHSVSVAVTSDPVAAAVAGQAEYAQLFDGYIGLIHGTGTNTGYAEYKRIGNYRCDGMYYNVESGNYTNLPIGVADTISAEGKNVTLERMSSGRYIGRLFHILVKDAIKNGLFSDEFAIDFLKQGMFTTAEVSEWIQSKDNLVPTEDYTILLYLYKSLINRAAKLIALEIGGAAVMMRNGRTIKRPICVIPEGTTLFKLAGLYECVEDYLQNWLMKQYDTDTKLNKIENAVLIGTGIIALRSHK